jgi:hypothetical protein
MIRELDKVEAERLELERRAADAVQELDLERVLVMITERDVREVLAGVTIGLEDGERDQVKERIRALLERVTLDERLSCQLHYAIPAITGDKLASPRQRELIPGNSALLRARERLVLLAGSRRRLRKAA